MSSYEKAIEAAVKKEMNVLGSSKTLEIVESIDGVSADDKGNITELDRDGKETLGELVAQFQEIGGNLTATLINRELEEKGLDDLDLPESL
ncbi:MAG: hypothetical protein ABEK01_01275 [Candidatus Nanohaloarchaea archaeon]